MQLDQLNELYISYNKHYFSGATGRTVTCPLLVLIFFSFRSNFIYLIHISLFCQSLMRFLLRAFKVIIPNVAWSTWKRLSNLRSQIDRCNVSFILRRYQVPLSREFYELFLFVLTQSHMELILWALTESNFYTYINIIIYTHCTQLGKGF